MRIQVEFLLTHKTDVYSVGRVPCIGEIVCIGIDGESHEVKDVIHILDADPQTQVLALVRAR